MTAERADPSARFPERYRFALEEAAGAPVELTDEHVDAVLALARDVAHRRERRNAPLATFLAGQFVVARVAGGTPTSAALREAAHIAGGLLGDEDER